MKNVSNDNEDSTKYGEFVSSYFSWKTLSKQKEIAKKLENITKSKNKNEKEINLNRGLSNKEGENKSDI